MTDIIHSKLPQTDDLGLVYDMVDGKVQIVGRMPMPKKKRFVLNLGPVDQPHTYREFDTQDERVRWMWAYRLCDSPEMAWYNDPADPGIVTNKHFRPEGLKAFSEEQRQEILNLVEAENSFLEGQELIEKADEVITDNIHAIKKILRDHNPKDINEARDLIVNKLNVAYADTIRRLLNLLKGIEE